jgi:hypothetical protein
MRLSVSSLRSEPRGRHPVEVRRTPRRAHVKLEPLYRLTFRYEARWNVWFDEELHQLLEGEGRCEGGINGRFHGTNRARRRPDGVFEPDYHGVIETDDSASILWDLTGYGFPDRGQVTAVIKHLSNHENYQRLNDVLCLASGEMRKLDDATEIILEVAEVIWEPAA